MKRFKTSLELENKGREYLNIIRDNIAWFENIHKVQNPKLIELTYQCIKNRLLNLNNLFDIHIYTEINWLEEVVANKLEVARLKLK